MTNGLSLLTLEQMNDGPTSKFYIPTVIGTVSTRENWEGMLHAQNECDWLEWRVDMLLEELAKEELEAVVRPDLPVLITVRASEEGGQGSLSLEERRVWYLKLLPLAKAIDVEIAHMEALGDVVDEAKKQGVAVIGSAHDFEGTFTQADMEKKESLARRLGADVVKLAHTLKAPGDLLIGTSWLLERPDGDSPVALMGMGALGPVSRLLYAQMGSCLVYGYLGDAPTAPGQLPAAEFRRIVRYLEALH